MRILSQMGWLWSPSTGVPIMCSMQQTVKVTNGASHEACLKWSGALVQAGSIHQKARQGLAFHSRASQRDSYQGFLLAWGCFDTLFCSTIYKSTARRHHMLHWENNYIMGEGEAVEKAYTKEHWISRQGGVCCNWGLNTRDLWSPTFLPKALIYFLKNLLRVQWAKVIMFRYYHPTLWCSYNLKEFLSLSSSKLGRIICQENLFYFWICQKTRKLVLILNKLYCSILNSSRYVIKTAIVSFIIINCGSFLLDASWRHSYVLKNF